MKIEERQVELKRLERLRALLEARNQIENVAHVVVNAASDDEAVVSLKDLLGCSDAAAGHIISTPLRMFRRGELLQGEIGELEALLKLP